MKSVFIPCPPYFGKFIIFFVGHFLVGVLTKCGRRRRVCKHQPSVSTPSLMRAGTQYDQVRMKVILSPTDNSRRQTWAFLSPGLQPCKNRLRTGRGMCTTPSAADSCQSHLAAGWWCDACDPVYTGSISWGRFLAPDGRDVRV